MPNNTETRRGTGSFRIRDGRILLFRVGPANAREQYHNRRPLDLVSGEVRDWDNDRGDYVDYVRRTPELRGFWAFPYPFQDAFFYSHVWRRELPARFREGAFDWAAATPEEAAAHTAAVDSAIREIRARQRPKLIWHAGPFYARVRPKGLVGDRSWWRYDRPRDFVEAARGHIWSWNKGADGPWRCRYSRDHLEIFVPG